MDREIVRKMPRRSVIVVNPQFSVNPVYQPSRYDSSNTINSNQFNRVGVIQGLGHVPQVVEKSQETLKVDIEEISNPPRQEVHDIFPPKRARKGPAPKLQGDEKCTICDHKATGFHYNVLSCEGCKNFFRRAIVQGLVYHCKYRKSCSTNVDFRPRCQWCRLQKCYTMGMKKEYINRSKNKTKKTLPDPIKNLIEMVKKGWETATDGIERPTKQSYLNTSVSAESDQYDHVTGVDGKRTEFFIEMAFYKTKRIIKFMNNIPGMHNLSSNARIWLFKESLAESMVMFNATTYDPARQTRQTTAPAVKWLDGEWRGKSDFYKCGMREEFVEPMFEVWDRIYQLHKQDKYVCSLLMILVLINPDRQMPVEIKTELDRIDQIQDQYTEALQVYLEKKYPKKSGKMLGKTLAILSNLRDISNNSLSKQLSQLQKMEAKMPSLLARLFSYNVTEEEIRKNLF